MDKYESKVKGTPLIYTPDGIQLGNNKLLFADMTDIAFKEGDVPAWTFSYNGRRMLVPYEKAEKEFVEPFIKNAMKSTATDIMTLLEEVPAAAEAEAPDMQRDIKPPAVEVPDVETETPVDSSQPSPETNPVKKIKKEKSNMTVCKHCGAEIAKNAKKCPHCGGKNKKPIYKRVWFIILCILAAIVIIGAIAGGGGDSKSTSDNNTSDNKGTKSAVSWDVGEGTAVTWTDSIGTKWVQLVVPVTNTGESNLYLESATFDLEDESGNLVQTIQMVSVFPDVIKPGETACYCEQTEFEGDSDLKLKVIPHVDVEEAHVDCIRLEVSETGIKNEEYDGGVRVTGRVKNTTEEDQDLVYVSAVLYDSDNNVIGSVFTILENTLASGETIGFEATSLTAPDDLNTNAVDHYEVFAYPEQFQL